MSRNEITPSEKQKKQVKKKAEYKQNKTKYGFFFTVNFFNGSKWKRRQNTDKKYGRARLSRAYLSQRRNGMAAYWHVCVGFSPVSDRLVGCTYCLAIPTPIHRCASYICLFLNDTSSSWMAVTLLSQVNSRVNIKTICSNCSEAAHTSQDVTAAPVNSVSVCAWFLEMGPTVCSWCWWAILISKYMYGVSLLILSHVMCTFQM